MDSFEINKIVASILLIALLFIGIGKISNLIFNVEKPETAGYKVELPESGTATQASEIKAENAVPFTIDVSQNGRYFIEEDNQVVEVSIGFLEDRFLRIIKSNPDIEVIIRGDAKASYESIAELLAVLQNNGANNFSLATQP